MDTLAPRGRPAATGGAGRVGAAGPGHAGHHGGVAAFTIGARPVHIHGTRGPGTRRLRLLTMVGYPDVAGMTEDLTRGFDMLGELPRTDDRYSNPASLATLASVNWDYVRDRTSRPRTGEYTEKLLAELVEETRLGRVVGPTRPPAGWNISTVPLVDVAGADRLVPPPPGRHFAAASFPIIQEDENGATKVRRGEDWRRAGHNATVKAHDVPTHHFVDDYVDIIRRVVELVGPEQAEALRIFGHDLLNAYRQWPVKEPAHSGTFLPAPNGVTMWFHMAMCFRCGTSTAPPMPCCRR